MEDLIPQDEGYYDFYSDLYLSDEEYAKREAERKARLADIKLNEEIDAMTSPEAELRAKRVCIAVAVDLVMRSPEWSGALRRVITHFHQWWYTTMRKFYRARRSGYAKPSRNREGERAFLEKHKSTDHLPEDYRYEDLFGLDFFVDEMMTTVASLASTPEEFEQIGKDAIEALDCLLRTNYRTSSHRLPGNLAYQFFQRYDKTNSGYGMRSEHGQGQFEYFYRKWGKWGAMMVAAHQGSMCDRHYDGMSYAHTTYILEAQELAILDQLTQEQRDGVGPAFVAYYGAEAGHRFLKRAPGVMKAFEEQGKGHLLPIYFRLASAAPKISFNHWGEEWEECEAYPILEADELLLELEAWEKLPDLKEEVLEMGIAVLTNGRESSQYAQSFSFQDRSTDAGMMSCLSVPALLEQWQEAGFSRKKIRQILQVPTTYPWLGENAGLLVEHALEIDQAFPGGVPGVIRYLSSMKKEKNVQRDILRRSQKPLPKGKEQLYLEAGKALIKRQGQAARAYFSCIPFQHLFERDHEAALQLMKQAEELSEGLPSSRYGRYKMKQDIFQAYALHCEDRLFLQYQAGAQYVVGEVRKYAGLEGTAALLAGNTEDRVERAEETLRRYLHELDHLYRVPLKQRLSLNTDIEFEEEARCVVQLSLRPQRGERRGTDAYLEFVRLVTRGWERSVAETISPAFADIKNHAHPNRLKNRSPLPEGVSLSDVQAIVDVIMLQDKKMQSLERALREEPEPTRLATRDYHRSRLSRLETFDAWVREQTSACVAPALVEHVNLEVLDTFMSRNLRWIKKQASIALFRQQFALVGLRGQMDTPRSQLLEKGGEVTQTLLSGVSFLMALGTFSIPGIETRDLESLAGIQQHPQPLIRDGMKKPLSLKRQFQQVESALRRNLALVVPRLEEAILKARMGRIGFMPVGGKVHTKGSMDPELVKMVRELFQLDQTSFKLIHAGESLLLPPVASGFEMTLLLYMLEAFGVVERDFPELQTGGAGRLNGERSALLGASMLLGTRKVQRYTEGSLMTTHAETARRILAYDAGVRRKDNSGLYAFDLDTRVGGKDGRTDKLGGRVYEDADLHQIIHNLAAHEQFEGPMAEQFGLFRRQLLRLLRRRGLEAALWDSSWVHGGYQYGDTADAHRRMLNTFVDARIDMTIVQRVRAMLQPCLQQVRTYQQHLVQTEPEKVQSFLYS